jgi:hypothetical protein
LSYFAGAWTPVGCDEQNPFVDSRGKAQMQPLLQCTVALQLPRQAAKPFALLRNWRAESVPAHRTDIPIATSNTVLIFSVMIAPYLLIKTRMIPGILKGPPCPRPGAF